jgi:hypothetical protein
MFFEAHNLSLLIEGEQVMLFLFLGKNQTGKQTKRFYMFNRAAGNQCANKFMNKINTEYKNG